MSILSRFLTPYCASWGIFKTASDMAVAPRLAKTIAVFSLHFVETSFYMGQGTRLEFGL
jgi:hypothetical protein